MSATPFTAGSPLPATLLVGAAARCLLDELLERALAPAEASAEVVRLSAAALVKEKESGGLAPVVLGQLGSVSLFGAARVVVVFGGHELLRASAGKAWIEKPTPRAHLVIAVVRSPRDGLPAVAESLPVATLYDAGPTSPSELRRWLERRLAKRGAKATPAAFEALLAQAGESLDALDSELEKLSLWRLGETIDAPHVEALCGHTAGRDFDQLWQALRGGRLGEALALLETSAREGLVLFGGGRTYGAAAVASALLPMLLSRIRRVATVAAANGRLVEAASGALELKPGYVRFLQQDAQALGRKLPRWQSAAVAAEVAQKRVGASSDREVLEQLAVELARA
jgi:DNA polymerase III delta subunit